MRIQVLVACLLLLVGLLPETASADPVAEDVQTVTLEVVSSGAVKTHKVDGAWMPAVEVESIEVDHVTKKLKMSDLGSEPGVNEEDDEDNGDLDELRLPLRAG